MANRRMFSKYIITSDSFLELSHSSQALYLQIGIEADDDGFVSSPKRLMRILQAKQEDLDILIQKGFLIPFDDVVLITHWKIHNKIRKDRYNKSMHHKYLENVITTSNEMYELIGDNPTETKRQPDDNQETTNGQPEDDQQTTEGCQNDDKLVADRLSNGGQKVNTGKYSLVEVSEGKYKSIDDSFESPSPIDRYKEWFRLHDCLGKFGENTQQELAHYLKELNEDLVTRSLQTAIKKVKSFGYAKKILDTWIENNIETIEQAEGLEKEYHTNKTIRVM